LVVNNIRPAPHHVYNNNQTLSCCHLAEGESLKTLFFVLVLVLLVPGLLVVLKQRGLLGSTHGAWPFYAKRPLTVPEQVLYHRLVKALPEHVVLAQVQVSRVLGVKTGFNFNEWNNRINRLSYDFVVCAKDATVLAAIELDEATHRSQSRASTDAKKERATSAAGIRLIRWHVKALPDEATLQTTFASTPANPSNERSASGALRPPEAAAHAERDIA